MIIRRPCCGVRGVVTADAAHVRLPHRRGCCGVSPKSRCVYCGRKVGYYKTGDGEVVLLALDGTRWCSHRL